MIKNEDYKNRVVFTKHGKVEFNEKGVADAEEKAEKSLAELTGFDIVKPENKNKTTEDSKPEEKVEENKTVEKKPTTRRTRTTTKKEDK